LLHIEFGAGADVLSLLVGELFPGKLGWHLERCVIQGFATATAIELEFRPLLVWVGNVQHMGLPSVHAASTAGK